MGRLDNVLLDVHAGKGSIDRDVLADELLPRLVICPIYMLLVFHELDARPRDISIDETWRNRTDVDSGTSFVAIIDAHHTPVHQCIRAVVGRCPHTEPLCEVVLEACPRFVHHAALLDPKVTKRYMIIPS